MISDYAGLMTSQTEHLDPYFMTDPEIEEMEAAMADVPDEDWNVFFEATFVDFAERP